MRVYTLRDVKAFNYGNPFFAENDDVASRMVGDAAGDQASMLGMHPEDFELFRIGGFDRDTAELMPHTPELLWSVEQILIARRRVAKDPGGSARVVRDPSDGSVSKVDTQG